MTHSWLCVYVVVMACVCAFVVADVPSQEEQFNRIPALTEPKSKKKYQCSSCKAFARELYGIVKPKLRGRPRLQEIEMADAIDPLCRQLGRQYGILMRNNFPTNEFSKNTAISRMSGSWITAYLENRCGELLERFEDDLDHRVASASTPEQFQEVLCATLDKSCGKKQAVKEDL